MNRIGFGLPSLALLLIAFPAAAEESAVRESFNSLQPQSAGSEETAIQRSFDWARVRSAAGPAARFLPDGPLLGIRLAAGVDDQGAPIRPAMSFDESEAELAAIVSIGAVKDGAKLTVEWRRLDGAGESERLFAHEIQVSAHQRAYSKAVSRGQMAAGLYEVTASLGGHQVASLWRVSNAGLKPGKVAPSSERAAAQLPAAGESGAVEAGPSEAAASSAEGASPRCELRPHGDIIPAPLVPMEVGIREGRNQSNEANECWPAILAGMVERPWLKIGEFAHPSSELVSPCDLSGGSDMPGTVVQLGAFPVGDEDDISYGSVVLEDPDVGLIAIDSSPESGSTVKPGDVIKLKVIAMLATPATGIRSLEIVSPEGPLFEEDYELIPCDPLRTIRYVETTYTVPDDPPPVIEIRARAEDGHGHTQTETVDLDETVSFTTEEHWTGRWRAEARHHVEGGATPSQLRHQGFLEARFDFCVGKDGAVHGTGTAKVRRKEAPTLTRTFEGGPSNCQESFQPSEAEVPVKVTGQRKGDEFLLRLETGAVEIQQKGVCTVPGAPSQSWSNSFSAPAIWFVLFAGNSTNPVVTGLKIAANDGAEQEVRGSDSYADSDAPTRGIVEHRNRLQIRKANKDAADEFQSCWGK